MSALSAAASPTSTSTSAALKSIALSKRILGSLARTRITTTSRASGIPACGASSRGEGGGSFTIAVSTS